LSWKYSLAPRREGHGDDVRVLVPVAAPRRPVILHDDGVTEAAVVAQVVVTNQVAVEQTLHLRQVEVSPVSVVVGCISYQLMRAGGAHEIEETHAATLQRAFNAQQRLLVRRDAHRPALRVLRRALRTCHVNLLGVHVFVAGTERARRFLDHHRVGEPARDQVSTPLRGNDDPATKKWIAT
jgi:hypothetical protein